MAESVGQIGLDLTLNQGGFEKQLNSIQSTADNAANRIGGAFKKIAVAAASAFAVKKMVDFGKSCMDAADIQEAAELKLETIMKQRMKATDASIQSIKDFASEQQQLGVVGDEVQLSGAQQLATFLKTSDSLKTLIPAMNNLAVQQNGVNVSAESMTNIGNLMGKVMQGQVSALSRVGISFDAAQEKILKYGTEQEKAATLAQVITDNVGEMNQAFANTPAGQMQQLKNNLGDVFETIGMGIQNFVTPLLKYVNLVIVKIGQLASAFKGFSELITGKKSQSGTGAAGLGTVTSGAEDATEGMDDASDAADNLTDSTKKAGTQAKKTAQEMRALMGFDKINKLQDKTETDSGSDSGGSGSGTKKATTNAGTDAIDYGQLAQGETELEKMSNKFDPLIQRAKELRDLFKKGFEIGFGNSAEKIDSIKNHLGGIKDSLKDIATDTRVSTSFNKMLDSIALNAGKVAGSMTSVGLTICDNLAGGIDKYLDQNKDYIKDRLTSIFDVRTEINNIIGDTATAFANVFDVFRGDNAKQCTADIIGIFSDGFLGAYDVSQKVTRDILDVMTGWFIDNQDKLKEAIDNTLAPISDGLNTVHEHVKETFEKINDMYDEHIAPFFQSIRDGISNIVSKLLDGYNAYIAPTLDELSEKFTKVWDEDLQPAIDEGITYIGKVADAANELWTKYLQPIIAWIVSGAMPVLRNFVKLHGETIMQVLSTTSKIVKSIFKILNGLVDFVSGVMSGNWKKAWKGIKEIFTGAFEGMAAAISHPVNIILSTVENMANGVIDGINYMVRSLNSISFQIPDWVPGLGGASFGFNLPQVPRVSLPRLAEGGYVKPNTPQLAMIGDNLHQGEVVAPEDKLREMAIDAAKAVAGTGGITKEELDSTINRAVMRIVAALSQLGFNIDGREIARAQRMAQTALNMQYNTVLID